MLEKEGYPFKSKIHSVFVERYQRKGMIEGVKKYYNGEFKGFNRQCPKCLQYQFSEDFELQISGNCCNRLKKDVIKKWYTENNKPYGILGLMVDEGGAREKAKCLAFKGNKLKNFQPLVPVTKEWEDWFIEEYNIDISDIYKPPYNFERTGCKGCPFGLKIQDELDVLKKYFPNELKQCEAIWKPVYDEYRRIGYRLRKPDNQMTLEDYDYEL